MRAEASNHRGRSRRHRRGYVMQAVLVILALLAIAVVLTMRDTAHGFREAASARAAAEMRGALQHGLNTAIAQISSMDPVDLVDPANIANWDIFQSPPPATSFLDPGTWPPPPSPMANAFQVLVGLRPGQRTQGNLGESADEHYGHIVEVQVLVRAIGAGLPPSEERLTVGVLVPRQRAHAN